MLKITTSWDDGDILDSNLASLLSHYGLRGTFYITKNYRPQRLSEQNICQITKRHEIGAHTLTHPDLRTLSPADKRKEIVGSKQWLENILSSEVKMFCYPKGLYDDASVSIAREVGFSGARTTGLGSLALSPNPFCLETTIQVYPFPFRKLNKTKYYWGKILEPYKQRAPGLQALGIPRFSMYSWLNLAKATFDLALKKGEVFHLWGHSWEIENYDMWDELEKFLQYISNRKDCVYVTNSGLLV